MTARHQISLLSSLELSWATPVLVIISINISLDSEYEELQLLLIYVFSWQQRTKSFFLDIISLP